MYNMYNVYILIYIYIYIYIYENTYICMYCIYCIVKRVLINSNNIEQIKKILTISLQRYVSCSQSLVK